MPTKGPLTCRCGEVIARRKGTGWSTVLPAISRRDDALVAECRCGLVTVISIKHKRKAAKV